LLRVPPEHALVGEIGRVERPFPLLVRVATGAGPQPGRPVLRGVIVGHAAIVPPCACPHARVARRPPRPRVSGFRRPGPAGMSSITLTGARTLFHKEVLRFWKVSFQTVGAPVLTAVLYLLIFGHVLEDRVQVYPGVRYTSFLIPGLVMMSVLQNSFANSSSSL